MATKQCTIIGQSDYDHVGEDERRCTGTEKSSPGGDRPAKPKPAPDAALAWDLIEQSHKLQTGPWCVQIDAARELLSSVVREADGQWFVYQVVHSPLLSPSSYSEAIITDAQQPEAAKIYAGANFQVAGDPVAQYALRAVRPFFWHELPELDPNLADWWASRSADLGDMMTIPIHHGPEVATLSIAPRPGRVAQLIEHTHLLYLMAQLVYQRAHRAIVEMALSVSPRRRSLLSPRETEVLNLVARGKSTSEISNELAISSSGVEFHIDGAKRKLNVSNRTHAVVKAIALGLIAYGHEERTPVYARDHAARR